MEKMKIAKRTSTTTESKNEEKKINKPVATLALNVESMFTMLKPFN